MFYFNYNKETKIESMFLACSPGFVKMIRDRFKFIPDTAFGIDYLENNHVFG